MGGERAHERGGREEDTWEERGHMGGEKHMGEERTFGGGGRTYGRGEGIWEGRGLLHLLFFLITAKSS